MRIHRPPAIAIALICSLALAACGGGPSSEPSDDGGATAGSPTQKASAAGRSRSDVGSLKGKTIVLDPGHNGGNAAHPQRTRKQVDVLTGRKECDTTGTETDAGYAEHAFNWDVSTRLASLLRDRGAKVILTRSNDTGVGPCINVRAAIGNDAKADAALSVHADGAPRSGHGFHIIEPISIRGHTDKIIPASRRLGTAIRDAYRAGTGTPFSTYRGEHALDPRDDLGGLNLSTVPKVFIECGNMRNPTEAARLSSPSFRQRIAASLTDGLADYFR